MCMCMNVLELCFYPVWVYVYKCVRVVLLPCMGVCVIHASKTLRTLSSIQQHLSNKHSLCTPRQTVRFWLTKLLGICVKKTEKLIIFVWEKQFVIKPVSQFAGVSKVG